MICRGIHDSLSGLPTTGIMFKHSFGSQSLWLSYMCVGQLLKGYHMKGRVNLKLICVRFLGIKT